MWNHVSSWIDHFLYDTTRRIQEMPQWAFNLTLLGVLAGVFGLAYLWAGV